MLKTECLCDHFSGSVDLEKYQKVTQGIDHRKQAIWGVWKETVDFPCFILSIALGHSDDIPDIKSEDIGDVVDQNEIQDTLENALPLYAPPLINLVW